MSTPLTASKMIERLFKFRVERVARPDHIPTLWRVEMWCGRRWIESRDGGLAALAVGDLKLYQAFRADEQDWFHALLLVNKLYIETTKAETKPNVEHT